MMSRISILTVMAVILGVSSAQAHVVPQGQAAVLADLNTLRALGLPILAKSDRAGVAYSVLTPEMQYRLSAANHAAGRCAGFEVLAPFSNAPQFAGAPLQELQALEAQVEKDRRWASFTPRFTDIPRRPEIQQMIDGLKEQNLRDFVTWASSYPNRDNRTADPNIAVRALVEKLRQILSARFQRSRDVQIELIQHKSTKQQSVRVRLLGRSRPNEIIVLGGHFDSINQGWGAKEAPGADDNASGSANVFEALRVIASAPPTERTLEFFWYAGEESGLLGSGEIAKDYKAKGQNVVAVLQLDMTLHPGSGEFVIGNVSDYTSAWLRDFLVAANKTYLNIKLIDDRCGYACSDHASWYRQGYPTLMPFEATMSTMNRKIHTANDVINEQSNFRHSLLYSKIAVIFAIELGNSTQKQPY